ncbi:MAG: hypothetical protein ACRD29_01340 [Acidimicrobiales bacterium]
MNFLGHAYVALGLGSEDPVFVLGAVLPDLVSMARVRLIRSHLHGPLHDGVRCHVDADAAFHSNGEFVGGAAALRTELTDIGLRTGPARAIGHVGWELLLDGALIGSTAETAFRRAVDVGEVAVAAVDSPHRARWRAFLSRWDAASPLRYDDPEWVGQRILVMLARRPRLRLAEAQLPEVVDVLERHAPVVRSVAHDVLSDTVDAVGRGD